MVTKILSFRYDISIKQWRRKMPKSVWGGGGGGGAHRHVIYLPSVKRNQYKRAVFGYMVIY